VHAGDDCQPVELSQLLPAPRNNPDKATIVTGNDHIAVWGESYGSGFADFVSGLGNGFSVVGVDGAFAAAADEDVCNAIGADVDDVAAFVGADEESAFGQQSDAAVVPLPATIVRFFPSGDSP
jgi:hypothetical protein